jgi:catechol 2,3-dioxygenase-like lactoylglutathione lyase family enzyme
MGTLGEARIVTCIVKDLAAARAFYVDQLGLSIQQEQPGEFVMVNLGAIQLCIDAESKDQPARGGGSTLIFQVDDVGQTANELDRKKVRYSRNQAPRGEDLEAKDPEGYTLVFTQRV